jgi:hypothetical protein
LSSLSAVIILAVSLTVRCSGNFGYTASEREKEIKGDLKALLESGPDIRRGEHAAALAVKPCGMT